MPGALPPGRLPRAASSSAAGMLPSPSAPSAAAVVSEGDTCPLPVAAGPPLRLDAAKRYLTPSLHSSSRAVRRRLGPNLQSVKNEARAV